MSAALATMGCSGSSTEEDDIPREAMSFSPSESFGFDDFGSPGAALGIAVDEDAGLVLLVGLKFDLPFYQGDFSPSTDVVASAAGWDVTEAVLPLLDEVQRYPILRAGVSDVAGIRTMSGEVTAILLEGDLGSENPARIFVADGGEVALTREDGPYDVLEGRLVFREVTNLGSGAAEPDEPFGVSLDSFYFEWDTDEQP